MALSDKEFNDIIEKFSKLCRKSFSETLRDLCSEAGIEFKLILSGPEKKEILKVLLKKDEFSDLLEDDTKKKIMEWLESKRGGRKKKGSD